MPVSGCGGAGLAGGALLALLLLPAPYLLPDLLPPGPAPRPHPRTRPPAPASAAAAPGAPRDLLLALALCGAALLAALADLLQHRLMERRVGKLSASLSAGAARLGAWDAAQAQLDGTLRVVQHATAEYNLLLLLLLRRARPPAPPPPAPSPPRHDHFLKSSLVEA